jgi:hypothetical protein
MDNKLWIWWQSHDLVSYVGHGLTREKFLEWFYNSFFRCVRVELSRRI